MTRENRLDERAPTRFELAHQAGAPTGLFMPEGAVSYLSRVAFYARFTGRAFTGTALPPTLEGKCGSGYLAEKPGPHDVDDWCGPSLV